MSNINNVHEKGLIETYETEKNTAENNKRSSPLVGLQPSEFYAPLCERKETSDAICTAIKNDNLQSYIDKNAIEYAYLKDGAQSALLSDNDGLQKLREILIANFFLSRQSAVWADFLAGLNREITTGNTFEQTECLFNEDGALKFITCKMTLSQLKKCAFGKLVDIDGDFLYGTSKLLKRESYKEFISIIDGTLSKTTSEPTLRLCNKTNNFLYIDRPIIIKGYNNGLFDIMVDCKYLAMQLDKKTGKITADSRFIVAPAGLYSLCLVGANEFKKRFGEGRITATKMYTLIQAVTAGVQQQSFLNIKRVTQQGRENIRLDKDAIVEICGTYSMRRGKKYVDYKKTIDFISKVARAYLLGLKKAGILQELLDSPTGLNALMIDTEHSAEFPKDCPNSVYIKIIHINDIKDIKQL